MLVSKRWKKIYFTEKNLIGLTPGPLQSKKFSSLIAKKIFCYEDSYSVN